MADTLSTQVAELQSKQVVIERAVRQNFRVLNHKLHEVADIISHIGNDLCVAGDRMAALAKALRSGNL